MIIHSCAREEREAGARDEEEIIEDMQKDVQAEDAGADYPAHFYTGLSGHDVALRRQHPGEISGRRVGPDYPAPGLSGLTLGADNPA